MSLTQLPMTDVSSGSLLLRAASTTPEPVHFEIGLGLSDEYLGLLVGLSKATVDFCRSQLQPERSRRTLRYRSPSSTGILRASIRRHRSQREPFFRLPLTLTGTTRRWLHSEAGWNLNTFRRNVSCYTRA
jgi:hypothetical protein